MLKNFTQALGLALLLVAANGQTVSAQATSKAGTHFGETITPKGATEYAKLASKMNNVDSLAIKVTGTVEKVCQVKGCWMTLTAPGQPDMRVTFKDYAFFMPKDISGKKVVVDGFARVNLTPVDELRHYAQDAGKSKAEIEAITEPLREITYEAKGVIILK